MRALRISVVNNASAQRGIRRDLDMLAVENSVDAT